MLMTIIYSIIIMQSKQHNLKVDVLHSV